MTFLSITKEYLWVHSLKKCNEGIVSACQFSNVLTWAQTYDFLDINEFKLIRRHVKELKETHFLFFHLAFFVINDILLP